MLMLGNLLKVSGVVDRLSKSAQNEIINIATLFLGLTIGATMDAASFLNLATIKILGFGFDCVCLGYGCWSVIRQADGSDQRI